MNDTCTDTGNYTSTMRSIIPTAMDIFAVQTTAKAAAPTAIRSAASLSPPPSTQDSTLRRWFLLMLLAFGAHLSIQASPVLAQATDAPSTKAADSALQEVAATVNINTASAGELANQLNGIGGSKAEAIVRYREQFGPFESVEELSEVTGIGDSTVARNRERLRTQ